MTSDLRTLALKVLQRRDSALDSDGTVAQKTAVTVPHAENPDWTGKTEINQAHNPIVQSSNALGTQTVGQCQQAPPESWTPPWTGHYARALDALRSRCPDYVPAERWEQAVADSDSFIGKWGEQAHALGWTARDLWGLHKPPDDPHPSYARLSRYDATGLCWLLQGRSVTALSSNIAAIQSPTGGITSTVRTISQRSGRWVTRSMTSTAWRDPSHEREDHRCRHYAFAC